MTVSCGGGDRCAFDLLDFGLLEHLAALARAQKAQERDQIFPRVELRLVLEPDSRSVDERNGRHELGVEAQLGGFSCFLLEIERFVVGGPAYLWRRVEQIPRYPVELTLDLLARDDAIDQVDGRQLCIPGRLRVIAAEAPDKL